MLFCLEAASLRRFGPKFNIFGRNAEGRNVQNCTARIIKIWLGHLKLKLRRRHSGNRHASKHDGLGYYYCYYYCLVWHTKKRSQNISFGGKKYKDYSQLPNDHTDQRHQCPCLSVIEYKEKLSVVSLIS